ncbi:D-inositol-3-phosphate glycosyltransferase [Solicola gregarius]|uniref:D-inositol-3-phosphate glycosyltransferase n=2 Tax=Solicola gregarius TaxID=2908642 RepID=A0AA46TM57_9ACTN|nr:D-inositol-3-phosphate glycosyltransferase [Solicola gregarius]UYM07836.1 D-inositol-3-phosphate glycosyltransferase [Solicola gregarius]
MLSAHTSPTDRPGTGDAGGMNVYVLELSRRLADLGIEVDIFTRATSSELPPVTSVADGVQLHAVAAGPFEQLTKADLPSQLCGFVRDVLRAEAEERPGRYDLIHSHYWLSGQVGLVARDRWNVPLVHSMHTMARVKNASLAAGDTPEPSGRIAGEQQIVDIADRLIANTSDEAAELVGHYGARPERVAVVHPGVDLATFRPADAAAARTSLGIDADADVLLFVGRIQPLKAPDVLLRAAALLRRDPDLRESLVVAVVGGPSGSGLERPTALVDLAAELGIGDAVRFVPPVDRATLARWYAAASVVCVPSYNESFGLVALEAQACGTPVVAADVGGLATAVRDGESGTLVASHDPADYAAAIAPLLRDERLRSAYGRVAIRHAAGFGWRETAGRTVEVYRAAIGRRQRQSEVAS